MEYLFAGLLGLIIIVSLFITFRGSGSKQYPLPEVRLRYICVKCGHEFEKTLSDFNNSETDMDMMMMAGGEVLDCPNPKCGAKQACWHAIQCPKCKKWYVSRQRTEVVRWLQAKRNPPKEVLDIKDQCPQCGAIYWEPTGEEAPPE